MANKHGKSVEGNGLVQGLVCEEGTSSEDGLSKEPNRVSESNIQPIRTEYEAKRRRKRKQMGDSNTKTIMNGELSNQQSIFSNATERSDEGQLDTLKCEGMEVPGDITGRVLAILGGIATSSFQQQQVPEGVRQCSVAGAAEPPAEAHGQWKQPDGKAQGHRDNHGGTHTHGSENELELLNGQKTCKSARYNKTGTQVNVSQLQQGRSTYSPLYEGQLNRVHSSALFEHGGQALRHCVPWSQDLNWEDPRAVGKWGEALVYQYLLDVFPDCTVKWMNEKEETRASYDLKISDAAGSLHSAEYIEVKTTKFSDKNVFELSLDEWEFANKPGIKYHIYRVYNAGNPLQTRITIIHNVVKAVRERRAGLCLVI